MRTLPIKTLVFIVLSLLFLPLLSCEKSPNESLPETGKDKGIRLKYFESLAATENAIKSFLKPGFELSDHSEIKDIGNYETGSGIYEYNCAWEKITPLDPNPGEYAEYVSIEGVPHGWDINDDHEQTTKEELLELNKGYLEVYDPRLKNAPYKSYLIILKKKDNKKGDWKFLAYIDPSHYIDGNGQRANFSGTFIPSSTREKAEYDVPADEMAVSVFLELVEQVK